jgi:uncharacterized protein with HEPN domain
MSKRFLELFAIDILIALDKIKRYCENITDAQTFLHDELRWDATIRELEIIGEATKHLLKSGLLNQEWRIVVDFRNVITHAYFGIDPDEVFHVIKHDIVFFEKEMHTLLTTFDQQQLSQCLDDSIEDFHYNEAIVKLLTNVKHNL